MTREQFQEKYKLSLPLKTRKEFEAARRRMGALTKDEKAILSAIVLQKGEAEAGEIFANSPERLRDYTILKGVNSYALPHHRRPLPYRSHPHAGAAGLRRG